MSGEQWDRLQTWLETKWRHGPCPVCQADAWFPAPNLGQIQNLIPVPPEGGKTVPVVLMACEVCGYIVTINAVGAGILAPEEDEQEGGSDTETAALSSSDDREAKP